MGVRTQSIDFGLKCCIGEEKDINNEEEVHKKGGCAHHLLLIDLGNVRRLRSKDRRNRERKKAEPEMALPSGYILRGLGVALLNNNDGIFPNDRNSVKV